MGKLDRGGQDQGAVLCGPQEGWKDLGGRERLWVCLHKGHSGCSQRGMEGARQGDTVALMVMGEGLLSSGRAEKW